MYALGSFLIAALIPLVSGAYVAPRDECYNITTSTTYASSSTVKAPYTLPNTTSVQQCQVAITSWVTTTVTIISSSGYLNSSAVSNSTPSSTLTKAVRGVRRSVPSTTKSASSVSSTTSSVNVNSLLSEFASMYSVLTQYEHNATASSSTTTAGGSFTISAISGPGLTSYTNATTSNTTLASTTCGSSCQYCTTIFGYATTTITATALPPPPISTLPPITVGNATYTPSGTYYVIDNSTLSPGGLAILISNSTLVSLSPSGTQLVIAPLSPTAGGPGPSTYDLSPAPASSPLVTTPTPTSTSTSISSKGGTIIEAAAATITGPLNLPVLIIPSQPIVIAGTTLTPGASAVTIHETPVSLAPSSDFLVVGSSTIMLATSTITSLVGATPTTTTSIQAKVGSLIWSGIGGTEPAASATRTRTVTSAPATFTSNSTAHVGQVLTSAATSSRGKSGASLWLGLGLGLGFATGWSIVMSFAISISLSTALTSIWAFETAWRIYS